VKRKASVFAMREHTVQMRPCDGHIHVMPRHHSHIASVKTGANRGHDEPVTPDERAPSIRGRFFISIGFPDWRPRR
jgi:hypothetical protein